MLTWEFMRYMIAMQGTKVPMQRIDMDIHPSAYDREEDRVQNVMMELAWRYEDGRYHLVIMDQSALHYIPGKPIFLRQTMSFRCLVWQYAQLDDETYNGLASCDHKDHTDCTPETHALPTAHSNHYTFMVHFAEIRKFYTRWLHRRCATVLTCMDRARKATIAHAPRHPIQQLVRHPYYDENLWRLVFAAAYPKLPHRPKADTRKPAVKRPAAAEAAVDLACGETVELVTA